MEDDGTFRLVPSAEALPLLTEVYDRCRRRRAGELSRPDGYWRRMLLDVPSRRHGGSARHYLVHHDAGGRPDGYALYRIHAKWDDGLPGHRAAVAELTAVDDEVEAALWRFVLDLDLVAEVSAEMRPLDDPLRWRLVEPRRLRSSVVADFLWARVLDVPAVLSARSYRAEGTLVVEVIDEFRPDSGGRFLLEAGSDGATCAPTTRSADVVLGASELGMLVLGGVTASELVGARRLDVERPGAVDVADLLFPTALAPFSATEF